MYVRPTFHVPDTSALLHKVGRLSRSGLRCISTRKGRCTFGAYRGLGGLLLSVLLRAGRLSTKVRSLSFSRRFVPARGCSAICSCGGSHNCFPNITAVNGGVIKIRGHSNGTGIHFYRRRALGEVFGQLTSEGVLVGQYHVSYKSFSRGVVTIMRKCYQRFCVQTSHYRSLCREVSRVAS